jgi:hypothetical protein
VCDVNEWVVLKTIPTNNGSTNTRWKDLNVTKWPITEAIKERTTKRYVSVEYISIQGSLSIQLTAKFYCSSSCGFFMLKFMEYWTGRGLSSMVI